MLGEIIKDGLPKLMVGTLRKWRSAPPKQIRKDLGSMYLNKEFGWDPLVRDLADLSTAITDADRIWRQYERDAGRLVRRRYDFKEETSIVMERLGASSPWTAGDSSSYIYDWSKPLGYCVREHSTSHRRWFEGAFMYYLPVTEHGRGSVAMNVIQAKKLLGLTLTPDTVWNLTPWSWATDWFANTGDILENWSNWAIDGQVLAYGYMMEHSISKYKYTWIGSHNLRNQSIPSIITTVTETKVRRKATPYGFGLTWDGFTSSQAAIVAALGLSRAK